MTNIYKDTTLNFNLIRNVSLLLRTRESMTLLWLPDGGSTFFSYKIQEKDFLSEFLYKEELDKTIWMYIDQKSSIDYIQDHMLASLSNYGSFKDPKEAMFKLLHRGYEFVVLVDNFHYDLKFFDFLSSIRNINVIKVRFIFSMLYSNYEFLSHEYKHTSSILFHNVIKIPYPSQNESVEWVQKIAKDLRIEFDKDLALIIDRFAGGNPALMKNYIRLLSNYNTNEEIVNGTEMTFLISRLWSKFSLKERRVIQSLTMKQTTFSQEEEKIILYLQEMNFLDIDTFPRGEWVHYAIKNNVNKNVTVTGNNLFVDEVDITHILTESERIFLIMLISSRRIISREEMGSLIFGIKGYTEWALDQFISRLRKKLSKLGLDKQIVKTVRGKGYKYEEKIVVNQNPII